jgi:hypothetical protein
MWHIIIVMETGVTVFQVYSADALNAITAVMKHRGVRFDVVQDSAPAVYTHKS